MNYKSITALALCFAVSARSGIGSSSQGPEVDIEIVNDCQRVLRNSLVRFGDFTCEWGTVIVATSKGYGHFPHPITPDAELHWDEDGKPRVEKLDLRKIYPPGKSGRLTFTVHDDRVEVTFREKGAKP